MLNPDLALIFKHLAIYEEMDGEPFKARAYEKAGYAIEVLDDDVAGIYKTGGLKALEEIPGVGVSIAEKIEEYIKTHHVKAYERFKRKFPMNIAQLYIVEGLGPKKIKLLWERLQIKNLDDLEKAAKMGKIASIPHLGEKTEQNILRGIAFVRASGERKILGYVLPLARLIEARFRKLPGVTQAVVGGSIRRRQETIGDIDLLVVTTKPETAQEAFVNMPEVAAVKAHGTGRSEVRLKNGLDADIRVVPPESFGAALQYFTGNKAHNIELRKRAIAHGYKLNEYGVFKGKKQIAGKTEEETYQVLGLDWMPPEIRNATGEIEAAEAHELPDLLPYGSVKGDLQVQSNWTDGSSSIEDLAKVAMEAGFEYIAITDHTKALGFVGGLDERKLEAHNQEIEEINKKIAQGKFGEKNKRFRILTGAEVNILKDGSLDIADEMLKKLDIVGVAVHNNFNLTREAMTARIVKALQNPYVHILFHPTGRIVNRRPPYEVDMGAVIQAAKNHKVALEVNAFPDRTDLKDEHVRMAVAAGVKLVINTDAHDPSHFRFMELGEATARRGWATKKDVLNTLPVEKLLEHFRKKQN